MCFHSRTQLERHLEYVRERGEKNMAWVAITGEWLGREVFIGGWYCDARKLENVRHALDQVRVWHRHQLARAERFKVDLSDVNATRKKLKLTQLKLKGAWEIVEDWPPNMNELAKPTKQAEEEFDKEQAARDTVLTRAIHEYRVFPDRPYFYDHQYRREMYDRDWLRIQEARMEFERTRYEMQNPYHAFAAEHTE